MSDEFHAPTFGDLDAEGFRTVSFKPNGLESVRVSLHIARIQAVLTQDIESQFSSKEREGLRTAVQLLTANQHAPGYDPNAAMEAMLEAVPIYIAENIEKHFPMLAWLALEAATDICVKHTLTGLAQSQNGPPLYGQEDAELILKDLRGAVWKYLLIDGGRPAETSRQLQKTRLAIERLDSELQLRAKGKRPTQEQVAEELDVTPRTLRSWLSTCNKTWEEWLMACGWREPNAEGN